MNYDNAKTYPTEVCEESQAPIDRALLELFAQSQHVADRAEALRRRLVTVSIPSAKLGSINSAPVPPKHQSSMRDQIDMIKAKLDETESTLNTALNELEI